MSPGQLIDLLSVSLGVNHASVFQADRMLSVAGLRSKSGRGPSAAKITPRDAAHLSLAVLSSTYIRDTVETTSKYLDLPSLATGGTGGEPRLAAEERYPLGDEAKVWNLAAFPIPALQALPASHSFPDALEGLFVGAMDGSIQAAAAALRPIKRQKHTIDPAWNVVVKVSGPLPRAEIFIGIRGGRWEKHDYQKPWPQGWTRECVLAEISRHVKGDMTQSRELTEKTIVAVGEALAKAA